MHYSLLFWANNQVLWNDAAGDSHEKCIQSDSDILLQVYDSKRRLTVIDKMKKLP